ncbi:MAG: hypothetical protein KDD40_07230 [Bdellovibrionales bacterium]|nr:hypothetical protein [Bdellovibrionales bacterium]
MTNSSINVINKKMTLYFQRLFVIVVLISNFWLVNDVFAAAEITIASVQFPIEGNQSKKQFFNKLENYIQSAVAQKADLILFPEWITLDTWSLDSKKSDKEIVLEIANSLTPEYMSVLKKLSQKYRILIAGGSTAKKIGTNVYNSAFVVYPNGKLIEHKKVYLTDWEIKNGISPGSQPTVFDTKWGKFAILICYDVEFPDISVDLSKYEIDVLLVSSMTESKNGKMRVRWTSQSRAVELTSYVVISPTVGEVSKAWKHFGSAVFLEPQLPGFTGILKEEASEKPKVVVQKLDLEKLRKSKKSSTWRPAKQIRKR